MSSTDIFKASNDDQGQIIYPHADAAAARATTLEESGDQEVPEKKGPGEGEACED